MRKEEPDSKKLQTAAVIFIAVCIIFLSWLFVKQMGAGMGSPVAGMDAGGMDAESVVECLADNGIMNGTVVFFHTNTCPHCNNMKPIAMKLASEGYEFLFAELYDSGSAGAMNCLSGYMTGYVPQFVCAYTGDEITGEVPEEELRAFAEKCRG